jgi:hypothetical protein
MLLWKPRAPEQQRSSRATAGTTRHEASAASIASPARAVIRCGGFAAIIGASNESYFGLQLWLERRKEAPHLEPSRKDKHARAGDSCEMPLAIAAPNTIKSSMLGVDISYIIRSSLYPLLLNDTHPARPALGGLAHLSIR